MVPEAFRPPEAVRKFSGSIPVNVASRRICVCFCFFCCWMIAEFHEARAELSSDIKYAGKLVFKLTCFGSLRPVSLLSWDVGGDTYLRESRMIFPCRRGRPVSKTPGRPNRPRGGRCHIFCCLCVSAFLLERAAAYIYDVYYINRSISMRRPRAP